MRDHTRGERGEKDETNSTQGCHAQAGPHAQTKVPRIRRHFCEQGNCTASQADVCFVERGVRKGGHNIRKLSRAHARRYHGGEPSARNPRRFLGSQHEYESIGGTCYIMGYRKQSSILRTISCLKTGWSVLTHSQILHQAVARSLRESSLAIYNEDTTPSGPSTQTM